MKECDFEILVGEVFKNISVSPDDDAVIFTTIDDNVFILLHHQDCCESVYVDDICGDINDLLNSPIVVAEEVSSCEAIDGQDLSLSDDSFTWTFYKLDTIKGGVTIRWFGESNGYYSESVSLMKQ